jgi:hypothetical protein
MHMESEVVSSPDLIKGCKRWDNITEKFHKLGLYQEMDYTPLHCKIEGNKAELVVGSSPGHKTHVNLEKGTVEYYDKDEDVNKIVKELFEETGLKCDIMKEIGVFCKGLSKENLQKVFETLSVATSMDLRIEEIRSEKDYSKWVYWTNTITKLYGDTKKLEECATKSSNPLETEKCLIKYAIEKM